MQSLKIWVLFVVLAFTTLAPNVAVQAHEVEPDKAQPAAGQVLSTSPAEVVLIFPEELAESSTVKVEDAAGKVVAQGGIDLNDADHATLRAQLPTLESGVYTVRWTIILTDGDSSGGGYQFGIGNVTVSNQLLPAEEGTVNESVISAEQPATQSASLNYTWLLLGILVVLLLVAGAILLLRRQPKA